MNIEKETSEYQRIVATVVGDLSKAELKFYLCVAEGGKGCNIGEPNDDLFPENDSEFVHIKENYGHPWHSDIKQFDLMYIDARNKEHKECLMKKYEKQYWHCWINAKGTIDKDGNRIPCDTHATMYKPSGDIKGEWDDTKEWGIHHILDSVHERDKKTISFEEVWSLIKV